MSKDRLGQEGRDEPEYPKLRSSSRTTPFLGRPLWIGLGYCSPNRTFDHGGTGHQVWLPARGGDVENSSPPLELKLTSAGEHKTKALRRTQTELTSRKILMKPEGTDQTRMLHLVIPLLTGLAQVALEDSSRGWLFWGEIELTQLNFIISF